LTPTSRRQDHTTWPSASAPFVKGASASTASRPTYRDDREPPPWKERDGISIIRKSEAVKPYSEIRKKYIPASAPANRREKRHPCATTRARQRNEEATLLPHWINIIHSQ
jgi:hypothetical protein